MANEKTNQSFLSEEQVSSISFFITDSYGSGLPCQQLMDLIYLVLEDVPGIEMESTQSVQETVKQIKDHYYGG